MSIFFSVEFDLFGFSVKHLGTGSIILRCNSTSDLYPFHSLTGALTSTNQSAFSALSSSIWHSRLGHPGHNILQTLKSCNSIDCNNAPNFVCHSCSLGKHVKLPFVSSLSFCHQPFDIIHIDIWTSPITCPFDFKYYVLFFGSLY